ncbi:unnamed protein product [Boreogadus saida]
MGQCTGVRAILLHASWVWILGGFGATSLTRGLDASGSECPENHIQTVEYPCSRAQGKNSTCYRANRTALWYWDEKKKNPTRSFGQNKEFACRKTPPPSPQRPP